MYLIKGFCHRSDIDMGRHGFMIDLHPDVKRLVKDTELTQQHIDNLIGNSGRSWLDAAGYNAMYDPDNYGHGADRAVHREAWRSFQVVHRRDLRVRWGEWGPEHITVPGNACGLDIERSPFGCMFRGGVSLCPHNVDSLSQKYLLNIVFTEIMYTLVLLDRRSSTAGRSTEEPKRAADNSDAPPGQGVPATEGAGADHPGTPAADS